MYVCMHMSGCDLGVVSDLDDMRLSVSAILDAIAKA